MHNNATETYRVRILRAILWLEEHLEHAVTLEEMAAQAHFSPFHFHRVFRGMVGESVKAYIRRLRLEKAVHRLAYTSASVMEISLDAGYEAQEAFSRAFKAQFRLSPSALRKKVSQTGTIPSGVLGENTMTKVVAGFTLESLGLQPVVKNSIPSALHLCATPDPTNNAMAPGKNYATGHAPKAYSDRRLRFWALDTMTLKSLRLKKSAMTPAFP